jgi:RNA polymerase sigma factor (sigma-70 family)
MEELMQPTALPDPPEAFRSLTDEDVHRKYKDFGDLDAYTYLYDKYWPRLLRSVHARWSRIRETKLFAEDICNEALLLTLEKPPFSTGEDSQLWRMLYRIAMNKAIDRLRRLGQHGGDDELDDGTDDETWRSYREPKNLSNPIDEVHGPWVTAAVEDCKSRLPSKYSTVLGLYITEGMTIDEIGDALGISHQRVSTIKKDALESLRRCLESKNIPCT